LRLEWGGLLKIIINEVAEERRQRGKRKITHYHFGDYAAGRCPLQRDRNAIRMHNADE
jgi:hypothetical protein